MNTRKFYNEASDCQWITETALKAMHWALPLFQSFCIEGNEDCPSLVILFREKNPKLGDKPVAYFYF